MGGADHALHTPSTGECVIVHIHSYTHTPIHPYIHTPSNGECVNVLTECTERHTGVMKENGDSEDHKEDSVVKVCVGSATKRKAMTNEGGVNNDQNGRKKKKSSSGEKTPTLIPVLDDILDSPEE